MVNPPARSLSLTGAVLTDREFVHDRVRDLARQYRSDDQRISSTLWWYMASDWYLGVPVSIYLATGVAVDPAPARLTVFLGSDGRLVGARPDQLLSSAGELATALRTGIESILAALDAPATGRSLWAVAADSLANRALQAGRAITQEPRACDLAVGLAEAIGAPMPVPRFIDVAADGQSRPVVSTGDGVNSGGLGPPPSTDSGPPVGRFTRRSSCCLLYLTPGSGKCASCPRQLPDVRNAILGSYLPG